MHTHIHTHTSMYVALGAAATYKQRVSPGLKKNQQKLTEQLGCLWFHDVAFTEAGSFVGFFFFSPKNKSCTTYIAIFILVVQYTDSHRQFHCSCHSSSQLRMVK